MTAGSATAVARVVTTHKLTAADRAVEASLRPQTLDEIVGQDGAVEALRNAVAGARERGELPSHMLLVGPAGTGKTTLAGAVANAVGADLTVLYGVNLRQERNLVPSLSKWIDYSLPREQYQAVMNGLASGAGPMVSATRPGHVLMIDEIHRMWQPLQELLYPVMEDGVLVRSDGGRYPLQPIMLVAATTDPNRLLQPLLDRFPLVVKLELYAADALAVIAQHAGKALGVDVDDDAAHAVAVAADGIPRVAIKIVRAARDWAAARGSAVVSVADVTALLAQPALLWRLDGRNAGGGMAGVG